MFAGAILPPDLISFSNIQYGLSHPRYLFLHYVCLCIIPPIINIFSRSCSYYIIYGLPYAAPIIVHIILCRLTPIINPSPYYFVPSHLVHIILCRLTPIINPSPYYSVPSHPHYIKGYIILILWITGAYFISISVLII